MSTVVEAPLEMVEADSQRFETATRHGSGPKCVDDLGAPLRANGGHSLNWTSRSDRLRTTMSAASSMVRML